MRPGGTCALLLRRWRGDADLGPDGGGEGQGRRAGCKQPYVPNKYYLYNYGGSGASRGETEGDSLFKGKIFLSGLDLNVQRRAGM